MCQKVYRGLSGETPMIKSNMDKDNKKKKKEESTKSKS